MRLPVVPQLSTKNGTANQNARLTNVLKETGKTGDKAVIRPALVSVLDYSGIGAGLIPFHNTLLSIYDDVIYADNEPGTSSSDYASPDVAFNLAAISWSSATTYSFGNGVWYDGGSGKHLWYSLVDSNTNNTPPAATSTVSAYWASSFPPAWNSGYTYSAGAAVHYGGYYWFSLVADNLNHTPETGDYWESPDPPVAGPKASGGTISYDGAYSIHTFTADGTFTVNIAPLTVDYLIVGGGGGRYGGGGGAGGLSYVTGHNIAGTGPITVTVGAGSEFNGAGATNGGDTTFITTVAGGGRGGGTGENGAAGGCGGGGGWGAQGVGGATTAGGAGSVGFAGGAGISDADDLVPAGGGGGGMGAVGGNAVELTSSGNGGDGVQNSISGAAVWYCGGGAGSQSGGVDGTAGQGRDGPGGGGSAVSGPDLAANDGIVIIRYLT